MKKMKPTLSMILAGVAVWATCSFAKAEGETESRRPRGERHHHPRVELTDEQKLCLEGLVGKPGEGERPTREALEKAFDTCGIAKPKRDRGDGPPPPPREGASVGQAAPAFD